MARGMLKLRHAVRTGTPNCNDDSKQQSPTRPRQNIARRRFAAKIAVFQAPRTNSRHKLCRSCRRTIVCTPGGQERRTQGRARGRKGDAHRRRQPNRLAGIARRASGDRPYKAGGRWAYHRNSARTLTPAPQMPAPPFSRMCDDDFVCCVDVCRSVRRPRSQLAIGGTLTPRPGGLRAACVLPLERWRYVHCRTPANFAY